MTIANDGVQSSADIPNLGDEAESLIAEGAEFATFEQFGEGFEPAYDFLTTQERLAEHLNFRDPDKDHSPLQLEPWECRIGGTKFYIPPSKISVRQRFKTGSMTGGALRQQNSPKFNTGHSDSIIEMSVYFPNAESIFGAAPGQFSNIDFDRDDHSKIEKFLSSLTGLIAQFKYSPFLPVQNAYLNQVYNITGVALKDIAIQTIPDYPFALSVTLIMYKFNHKIYLPMIEDFNQALDWNRFYSYMGRAAQRIVSGRAPINEFSSDNEIVDSPTDIEDIGGPLTRADNNLRDDPGRAEVGSSFTFRPPSLFELSRFDFYFPFHTPAAIDIPDLDDLRYDNDPQIEIRRKSWWEKLLGIVGVDTNVYESANYSTLENIAREQGNAYFENLSETKTLIEFLRRNRQSAELMTVDKLEEYVAKQLDEKNVTPGSEAEAELRNRIHSIWFYVMYKFFLESPALATALANEAKRTKQITINEWEVPMWKLGLDPRYTRIEGVSVVMGNVLAKLQLQMQDEPTHQHIGGEDTHVTLSMLVSGEGAEQELTKLRTMFESISGLARLEHGHGVLGFIGVKSVITNLVGMRHAIPKQINIETIEGVPHAYRVEISLVDFDVFQQRREELGLNQQAELIEAFGKRNPFLRIKQLWGFINAYPDFPLAVRDDDGKIVGHIDPDYYYRSFKAIDDDLVTSSAPTRPSNLPESLDHTDFQYDRGVKHLELDGLHINFGSYDGTVEYASVTDRGISLYSGGEEVVKDAPVIEQHAGLINKPTVDGLSPASNYVEPYMGGAVDPSAQFEAMAKDMQYRDKSGRMIRAFPTYMLWLIDEGGNFGGTKLFDNFYGLQSVLDFSIVRSEDIEADTLVLRLSNLFSKLSTKFGVYLDEDNPGARIINEFSTRNLRLNSGITQVDPETGDYIDYQLNMETIQIKPGVRLHLRAGYSSNPNALETVFNGVITEVEQGEIITVIAQSDAVELTSMVNSTNTKGHTGKVDGSMVGLYLSEPRDLMITLMTQGSTVVKENIAHASRGEVFSENRYGIKHFGTMLYTPLSTGEDDRLHAQRNLLSERIADSVEEGDDNFLDTVMLTLLHDAWINLTSKPDYEIFKRNIYPGNGTGIGQFTGGDLGDVFTTTGADGQEALVTGVGVGNTGTSNVVDPLTGQTVETEVTQEFVDENEDLIAEEIDRIQSGGEPREPKEKSNEPPRNPAASMLEQVLGPTKFIPNVARRLGLMTETDIDEVSDEISFRAQTYMKTVWDLFKVCAALMPNYVVAVRPFEDRSTVFYGKPHWLYTSGVVPLTTGATPSDGPQIVQPDLDMEEIFRDIEAQRDNQANMFNEDIIGAIKASGRNLDANGDPYVTTEGAAFAGTRHSVLSMPVTLEDYGVGLPHSEGLIGIEMHLPTSEDLETDIDQHRQISELPPRYQHPFYMDRGKSDSEIRGGYADITPFDPSKSVFDQTILEGEDANNPGQPGAMGYLDPEVEQWYCNMRWVDENGGSRNWRNYWLGKKILIYCPNKDKAVVCTPAEYGPAESVVRDHKVVAGCSPDAWWALGAPDRGVDICYYRIAPDNTPLGPVNFSDTGYTSAQVASVREQSSNTSSYPDWMPRDEDRSIREFALQEGWKNGDIPINYTTDDLTDTVGELASDVYKDYMSKEDAEEAWDEFRDFFPRCSPAKDAFRKVALKDKPEDEKEAAFDQFYDDFMNEFLKAMWEDPARRGWLPRVVHARRDALQIPIIDVDIDIDPSSVLGRENVTEWRVDDEPVLGAWRAFLEGETGGLDTFLQANTEVGAKRNGVLESAVEQIGRTTLSGLTTLGSLGSALFNVAGGLLSYLRLTFNEMTHGIYASSQAQKRANLLNRVYNDSIYYNMGVENGKVTNPLLFYADNPFTREYGEPVAEIREPFQRLHKINSFRHIMSNRIIESLDNVATVITAVSDGSDPVTVHFDKGTPAERQFEKTVETGLFYDDPGWGAIFNWGEQAREFAQKYGAISGGNAAGPELHAKRVALWHLKENLKDIYSGEITIIGDPSIRPYDLCYIGDVYSRMYGIVEVEQVVHHFSPDTGFITSITPNACVSINDPGQFYLLSNWKRSRDVEAVRERFRSSLRVTADHPDPDNPRSEQQASVTVDDLLETVSAEIDNGVTYWGGKSNLVKALGGLGAGGNLVGGVVGWKVFKWVRDNLWDQHGAYIQYLTKNGQPMDAGLSYNEGVAVGHQRSIGLLIGGLKLSEISTVDEDGNQKIRMQDVIPLLQWDEIGPNEHAKELDLFVDATMAELRNVSGVTGGLAGNVGAVTAYYGKVTKVIDGDTLEVDIKGKLQFGTYSAGSESLGRIRIAGVDTPEDEFKDLDPTLRSSFHGDDPGVRATEYTKEKLLNKFVALRVLDLESKDKFERTIAHIFHAYPDSLTTEEEQRTYMLAQAGVTPLVPWNSFTKDGKPRTFDWQLIMDGHGNTVDAGLEYVKPGRGVRYVEKGSQYG